ncbi:MAG: histidine phosphatase family protein [Rhodospirillaceae bacterium]|nr:histidine phosphatase family protein [Rhodospirillaceae bacterium]
MQIYVIRHGQTDWNADGRMQGQRDIPLNSLGRAQANGNGAALKVLLGSSATAFDYVASPLSRTRETMLRVRGAMGLDPRGYTTDERLLEVSFGDWEGYTLEEPSASARNGISFLRVRRQRAMKSCPGGWGPGFHQSRARRCASAMVASFAACSALSAAAARKNLP